MRRRHRSRGWDEKKWTTMISCRSLAYQAPRAATIDKCYHAREGTEPPPDIPARYDVDAAVAAAVAAAGFRRERQRAQGWQSLL